jgi:DNA-binding MarR family transcriptional regulator
MNPHISDRSPAPDQPEHAMIDGKFLRAAAAEIYAMRRRRDKYLSASLVGEPAWDMLLAAYLAFPEPMAAPALADAAASPPSTGARWVGVLEKDGLLERCSTNEQGGVRALYRLTSHGRAALEQVLGAMFRD